MTPALKIALLLGAWIAAAGAWAWLVGHAPEGWEDAEGFHHGRPPSDSDTNEDEPEGLAMARSAESHGQGRQGGRGR